MTKERNVLFIFPTPDTLKEARFGAPLGILYLASELISSGYNVVLADFSVERYSLLKLRRLLDGKDIVGISIPSYSLNNALRIIEDTKSIDSEMPIIAGGPDCILFPRLINGTDATVTGEAENTIINIFDFILEKKDLFNCGGVIYKNPNNRVINSGYPPILCQNLDSIRFPARHLVSEYAACGGNLVREDSLPISTLMITSRGCPLHCRFCARHALSYTKYRERSVENVIEEIEEIYRAGYKIVWICDDNFGANIERAYKIMEGIIELKIDLSFAFSGWVGAADRDLYEISKRAGVRIISFGLESGNQDVLDFYKKPITLEQIRYAVELADKIGIFTVGNFIFGAPVETREHLENTLNFAESLPLDTVNFKILGYMAGSELWFEAVKKGLIHEDERNVFSNKNRGLGNFTLQELEQFTKKAYKEFTRNKSRQARLKNKIRNIGFPYAIERQFNL